MHFNFLRTPWVNERNKVCCWQAGGVGSFPRTKREVFSGTKIDWFEFGVKYLDFGPLSRNFYPFYLKKERKHKKERKTKLQTLFRGIHREPFSAFSLWFQSPVYENGVLCTKVSQWGQTCVHTEVCRTYTKVSARGTPVNFRGNLSKKLRSPLFKFTLESP